MNKLNNNNIKLYLIIYWICKKITSIILTEYVKIFSIARLINTYSLYFEVGEKIQQYLPLLNKNRRRDLCNPRSHK